MYLYPVSLSVLIFCLFLHINAIIIITFFFFNYHYPVLIFPQFIEPSFISHKPIQDIIQILFARSFKCLQIFLGMFSFREIYKTESSHL